MLSPAIRPPESTRPPALPPRRQDLRRRPAPIPELHDQQAEAASVVVISLDPDSSREWTTRLRRVGLRRIFTCAWGDTVAYRTLLGSPRSLAVLDVPDHHPLSLTLDCVRALQLIGPVAVMAAQDGHVHKLLNAGAIDALPRYAPASELSARLKADLRWLSAHRAGRLNVSPLARPSRLLGKKIGSKGSQTFMLELLTACSGSGVTFCCHDLRLLLGTPESPMTPRALRGRMTRVHPLLAALGHRLSLTHQWGRDSFRVEPAARGVREHQDPRATRP